MNVGRCFCITAVCCMALGLSSCDGFGNTDMILSPFSHYWQAPMDYDDSGATKKLNVAAVCLVADPSPTVNRDKMISYIDKIKAEQPGVRLVLFPETALGYYYRPSDPASYQKSVGETIPGATTNALAQKAVEHQIYVSFGMSEKSGGDMYNSQVLISPDGRIAFVHRKNYLTEEDEKSGFKPGQGVTVDNIDGIRTATIICRDMNSFKVNEQIYAAGAELVLFPKAVSDEVSIFMYYPALQRTNTWVLGVNRTGTEDGTSYNGLTYLSAPGGIQRVTMSGREGYIYGVVSCW